MYVYYFENYDAPGTFITHVDIHDAFIGDDFVDIWMVPGTTDEDGFPASGMEFDNV